MWLARLPRRRSPSPLPSPSASRPCSLGGARLVLNSFIINNGSRLRSFSVGSPPPHSPLTSSPLSSTAPRAPMPMSLPQPQSQPLPLSKRRPPGFWSSRVRQRQVLLAMAPHIGLGLETDLSCDLRGWYKVSLADVRRHGGAMALAQHGNSLAKLLTYAFPEHTWVNAEFSHKPRSFGGSYSEQRALVERIGSLKLGIVVGDLTPWYSVSSRTLSRLGADSVLQRHGRSVSQMLSALFPEHSWEVAKFLHKPQSHWSLRSHQRLFLSSVASSLGFLVSDVFRWYRVTASDLVRLGGSGLLAHFSSSPRAALMAAFPDLPWRPWLFKSRSGSASVWDELPSLQRIASVVESHAQLSVSGSEREAWYGVTRTHFSELELEELLSDAEALLRLLRAVYPDTDWRKERMHHSLRGRQD